MTNATAPANATISAAIGTALPTGTIGGTAVASEVALVGGRLATGFYGAAANSEGLALGIVTKLERIGTDEVETLLRAAVAVLLTGVAIWRAGVGGLAPVGAGIAIVGMCIVVVLAAARVALFAVVLFVAPLEAVVRPFGCGFFLAQL